MGKATLDIDKMVFNNNNTTLQKAKLHFSRIFLNNNDIKIEGLYTITDLSPFKKLWFDDTFNVTGKLMYDKKNLTSHFQFKDIKNFFQGEGQVVHLEDKKINYFNFKTLRMALNQTKFYSHQFFPAFYYGINLEQGFMMVKGESHWKGDVLPISSAATTLDVDLNNVSGYIDDMAITALSTHVAINQFAPLKTEPNQRLVVKKISEDLNLSNVDLTYQILSDTHLNTTLFISKATAQFAGGHLKSENIYLSDTKATQPFTVLVNNVQVKDFFNVINLEGLSGTGVINGYVAFKNSATEFAIHNGELKTTLAGGMVKFKPKRVNKIFEDNQKAGILLDILSNFHYKQFHLKMKRLASDTEFLAILEGKNPDYYEGIPLLFNLHLHAPLESLLFAGFIGERLAKNIRYKIISASEAKH